MAEPIFSMVISSSMFVRSAISCITYQSSAHCVEIMMIHVSISFNCVSKSGEWRLSRIMSRSYSFGKNSVTRDYFIFLIVFSNFFSFNFVVLFYLLSISILLLRKQ